MSRYRLAGYSSPMSSRNSVRLASMRDRDGAFGSETFFEVPIFFLLARSAPSRGGISYQVALDEGRCWRPTTTFTSALDPACSSSRRSRSTEGPNSGPPTMYIATVHSEGERATRLAGCFSGDMWTCSLEDQANTKASGTTVDGWGSRSVSVGLRFLNANGHLSVYNVK